MSSILILRGYQHKSSEDVRKMLALYNRILLCLPTGSGKTIIAIDLMVRAVARGLTCVFLTDRLELVDQTFHSLYRNVGGMSDIIYQMIDKDTKYLYAHCKLFLGMVETFHRRQSSGKFDKKVDLFILDEAHMGNYKKIIDSNPEAMIVGLTATPVSSNEHRMRDLYQEIVIGATIPELLKDQWLVPSIEFSNRDILNMKIKAGEFSNESQASEFKRAGLDKKLADFLKRDVMRNRKSIIFNIDIEHSIKTTERLVAQGFNAVHVDSKSKDREEIFRDYKAGKIQYLCNVGLTTKGFDDPPTDGIVLNRSTNSMALFWQMLGRGARPSPGKDDFCVLDLGNNFFRHGSYHDSVDWESVFWNEEQSKKPAIGKGNMTCGVCESFITNRFLSRCHLCGAEFPKNLIIIKHEIQPYLLVKPMGEMTHQELTEYAKHKGYKPGWVWIQAQNNRLKRGKYNQDDWKRRDQMNQTEEY